MVGTVEWISSQRLFALCVGTTHKLGIEVDHCINGVWSSINASKSSVEKLKLLFEVVQEYLNWIKREIDLFDFYYITKIMTCADKSSDTPDWCREVYDTFKVPIYSAIIKVENKIKAMNNYQEWWDTVNNDGKKLYIEDVLGNYRRCFEDVESMLHLQKDIIEATPKLLSVHQVQTMESVMIKGLNWMELPMIYRYVDKDIRYKHMSVELGIPFIIQFLVYDIAFWRFNNVYISKVQTLLKDYTGELHKRRENALFCNNCISEKYSYLTDLSQDLF